MRIIKNTMCIEGYDANHKKIQFASKATMRIIKNQYASKVTVRIINNTMYIDDFDANHKKYKAHRKRRRES